MRLDDAVGAAKMALDGLSTIPVSDLPPVFREMPQFVGPIGQLPVALRKPNVLHITILKADPITPFAHFSRDVANALRSRVDVVSALGSEEFYSGWCLTYGTARMFEDVRLATVSKKRGAKWPFPPGAARGGNGKCLNWRRNWR